MYTVSNVFVHGFEPLRRYGRVIDLSNGVPDSTKRISDKLLDIMHQEEFDGITPQNILPINGFTEIEHYQRIMCIKDFMGESDYTLLNPSIDENHGYNQLIEGCGSIRFADGDYIRVLTERPHQILVSGYNLNGEKVYHSVSEERDVMVISHELNHLNGRLISDMARGLKILQGEFSIPYNDGFEPVYMVFEEDKFIIHNIHFDSTECKHQYNINPENGMVYLCFDVDIYDLPVGKKILLKDREYPVEICDECAVHLT